MSDSKEKLYQEGFTAEQVDAILQRAAELQTGSETAGVQLNKADLEAGAEAAGIDRAFIDQAIREIRESQKEQALRQAKRTRLMRIAVPAAVALIVVWAISANFILNSRLANVEEKQAQLENVLQRRHDLIPNLISVAKTSAAHEKELINSINEIYNQVEEAPDFTARQSVEEKLDGSLRELMASLRANPEASSNAIFIRLSDEMAGAENRIAVERKRYNEAAAYYNRAARGLFVGSMGRLFGYPGEMPYFQTSLEARKAPAF